MTLAADRKEAATSSATATLMPEGRSDAGSTCHLRPSAVTSRQASEPGQATAAAGHVVGASPVQSTSRSGPTPVTMLLLGAGLCLLAAAWEAIALLRKQSPGKTFTSAPCPAIPGYSHCAFLQDMQCTFSLVMGVAVCAVLLYQQDELTLPSGTRLQALFRSLFF